MKHSENLLISSMLLFSSNPFVQVPLHSCLHNFYHENTGEFVWLEYTRNNPAFLQCFEFWLKKKESQTISFIHKIIFWNYTKLQKTCRVPESNNSKHVCQECSYPIPMFFYLRFHKFTQDFGIDNFVCL